MTARVFVQRLQQLPLLPQQVLIQSGPVTPLRFGWIKAAFFETWTPPLDAQNNASGRPARTPVGFVAGLALGTLALASIALGFYQGPLGQWLTAR